jgi:putative NADPH-quinone reductase
MRVLTVVSHPRTTSLTCQIAQRLVDGLRDGGNDTDVLDLYRSGFDPVLREADEPHWSEREQAFSVAVEREMARLRGYEALAFVFPVWWWSLPAMLKGYVDRVWNYGFAYGHGALQHRRVLWLGLAGSGQEKFVQWGFDREMAHYFDAGLARYCGIGDSRTEILYETTKAAKHGAAIGPAHLAGLMRKAYDLGLRFAE